MLQKTDNLERLWISAIKRQNEAFLTALVEMITCVVKESPALRSLDLSYNNYCGGELAQILGAIRSNNQARTILKTINLSEAKWDTDQACLELAELLAHAHQLESCKITGQKGDRQIRVELEQNFHSAQNQEQTGGTITIYDQERVVICQVPTERKRVEIIH